MRQTELEVSAPQIPGLDPKSSDATHVAGEIMKVRFTDIDTGFSILRVRRDGGDVVTVQGRGDAVVVGGRISAEGKWVVDPKWGRQFKAKFIQAEIPETPDGIVRYLANAVDGIGRKTAERIVAKYGTQTAQVLESPTMIAAADVPDQKAKAIADHWKLRTRYGRLLSMLYAHDIGPGFARRIIDVYGDGTMQVIQTNPYKLIEDVRGIGFKTADQIALSQSMPREAPERARAGLLSQVQQYQRSGHCATPANTLIAETSDLLMVKERLLRAELDRLIHEGRLVEDTIAGQPVLFDKRMRDCEIEVAERIVTLARPATLDPGADIDGAIGRAAAALGLALHEDQHRAVALAIRNQTAVITGGPGMGKTSVLRTFLNALDELAGQSVPAATSKAIEKALAAPTGRAAKRMAEATGLGARTLHRLLEFSNAPGHRGFTRNADNPLQVGCVVIDEGSMMDLFLIRDVLRALPEGCRLVIVGDADQLPSVGAGNVLADLIASGVVPTGRLTKTFRQKEGSAIATAARMINQATVPEMTAPSRSSDLWGVFEEDPKEVVRKTVKLVTELLPKVGWEPMRDVQVLTPGNNNDCGTHNLNLLLQQALNPRRDGERWIEHRNREFRVRDRIIQMSNNYDDDVFNGDLGVIVDIDMVDGHETVLIDFDGNRVTYQRSELDQISHAYAMSIHRSQGGEYPVVIVVMTTQHYIMLRRNLIYTGVTRARSLCCIIGQARAVQIAVKTDGSKRLTGLAERIAGLGLSAPYLQSVPTASSATDDDGGLPTEVF
ncbi:ATP-dependent RecD-like DNA helicase [Rhodovibrio sodomensis]|uniref:ATP-dependent RecD2 DNA helicase n=1 Tax=Rhodovibrio sodomensis TaxID=1088 RepID=A0ABS1DB23_9PROT|nr:ATP-dependent RecD-like DNA helicase [Rhodovibrio sodomensis]MBK1666908.1 ATP-dependent RecD-like DNA helicase [Rhodovibrio sodomensis]